MTRAAFTKPPPLSVPSDSDAKFRRAGNHDRELLGLGRLGR